MPPYTEMSTLFDTSKLLKVGSIAAVVYDFSIQRYTTIVEMGVPSGVFDESGGELACYRTACGLLFFVAPEVGTGFHLCPTDEFLWIMPRSDVKRLKNWRTME